MNTHGISRRPPTGALVALLFASLLVAALPALGAPPIKVTSAVPDTGEQGAQGLLVRVAGDGFGGDSQVAFYVTRTTNPGGIAVKGVTFIDAKNLDVTIDVAPDAQTTLKFDIQVKSNGRTGKGTELFKVMAKQAVMADPEITYIVPASGWLHVPKIMVCNSDGASPLEIYATRRKSYDNIRWPKIAPDRRSVVFIEYQASSRAVALKRTRFSVTNGVLQVVGTDTLVPADVAYYAPQFSPDGSKVLYILDPLGLLVELTLATGENRILFTPEPGWVGEAVFGYSLDGSSIYFMETHWPDPPATSYFKRLDLDGSGLPTGPPVILLEVTGLGSTYGLSGHEHSKLDNRLAVAIGEGAGAMIHILDLDAAEPALEPIFEGRVGSWSPDDPNEMVIEDLSGRLRKLDLVTGAVTPLTPDVSHGIDPNWR